MCNESLSERVNGLQEERNEWKKKAIELEEHINELKGSIAKGINREEAELIRL